MDGIGKTHHYKHNDNNAELLFVDSHILLHLSADGGKQSVEGDATDDTGIGQNCQECCVTVEVKFAVADDGTSKEGHEGIAVKRQPAVEVIAVCALTGQECADFLQTDGDVS